MSHIGKLLWLSNRTIDAPLNQVLRRLNNDISKNFITVENYRYKRTYAKSAPDVHPHHLLIISPSTPSRLAFVASLS